MEKAIIRLTESELMEMVNESIRRVCNGKYGLMTNEDVLGNNWHERDDNKNIVSNAYEPFADQIGNDDDEEYDYDPDEPLYGQLPSGDDPTDNELYNGGW